MEWGEQSCLFERAELLPFACYLLPFLSLCGLRRRGVAFTMSGCLSVLYITQQYTQSSSSLLPSTAGPNNRSIVLPEIKTSTIVAVENNASYWRHDVTWRVSDWRTCPRNGHRWFENFIAECLLSRNGSLRSDSVSCYDIANNDADKDYDNDDQG